MTDVVNADTEANQRAISDSFDARREGRASQYSSEQQFIDEVLDPVGGRFTTGRTVPPGMIRSVHADDAVISSGTGLRAAAAQ